MKSIVTPEERRRMARQETIRIAIDSMRSTYKTAEEVVEAARKFQAFIDQSDDDVKLPGDSA